MEEVKNKTKITKPVALTRKKKLQSMLESVSQQMYLRNKELATTNNTLSLLRGIDSLVLESHAPLKVICQQITEELTSKSDYPFVGLFTRSSPSREELTLYGWSGKNWQGAQTPVSFSKPVHLKTNNHWLAQPEVSQALTLEGLTNAEIATFLDCPEVDIRNLIHHMPLKSAYTVKLLVRHRLVGLLVVGFYNPVTQITDADKELLDRLSESIGVALDNKLLFEENQHVLRQLKASNAKLLALDEAKDDFISMASHQLRTPLTSVKGYISMINEGDAGKVTAQQKKMLDQAAFSSQRMVYLIADLLNVSRLRTGKFIIEPRPVNLAKVISEEIGQLIEIAKARNLTLKYKQPAKFPEIMLDETKTRQVIMNFVDNAIYYTPAGGTITVELVDTPTSVEMHVKDNGIGVPRSEQAHLFTKFYRAPNARKARPDGTGLGLFMAKKVIVAQGGALIFDSVEGKGSDFGFTFSKTKLAVPAAGAGSTSPDPPMSSPT